MYINAIKLLAKPVPNFTTAQLMLSKRKFCNFFELGKKKKSLKKHCLQDEYDKTFQNKVDLQRAYQ